VKVGELDERAAVHVDGLHLAHDVLEAGQFRPSRVDGHVLVRVFAFELFDVFDVHESGIQNVECSA